MEFFFFLTSWVLGLRIWAFALFMGLLFSLTWFHYFCNWFCYLGISFQWSIGGKYMLTQWASSSYSSLVVETAQFISKWVSSFFLFAFFRFRNLCVRLLPFFYILLFSLLLTLFFHFFTFFFFSLFFSAFFLLLLPFFCNFFFSNHFLLPKVWDQKERARPRTKGKKREEEFEERALMREKIKKARQKSEKLDKKVRNETKKRNPHSLSIHPYKNPPKIRFFILY